MVGFGSHANSPFDDRAHTRRHADPIPIRRDLETFNSDSAEADSFNTTVDNSLNTTDRANPHHSSRQHVQASQLAAALSTHLRSPRTRRRGNGESRSARLIPPPTKSFNHIHHRPNNTIMAA